MEATSKSLLVDSRDRNTNFFHSKANERRISKEIKHLQNERGEEVWDKEGIQGIILNYFQSIFGSSCSTDNAMEEVIGCFDCRITAAMNDELLKPFTSEEITQAQ
ncbi:UNVERIFIED_CONTAM: hypothetical protein Slati_1121600 [Sesamum latifolium]|uniref:Uncharacterized protein n=1 Tax=Sesamum latifolium TaxID=2727402 RepID=A0AAW2XBD0_9LAMI